MPRRPKGYQSLTSAAEGKNAGGSQPIPSESQTQARWNMTQPTTTTVDLATGQPVANSPTPGVTGAQPAAASTQAQATPQTQDPAPQAQTQTPPQSQQTTQPEKTFSQAELDAIIKARLSDERKKFSDYDSLKAKAKELDTLKEGQKTDDQKTAEKVTALESRIATTEAEKKQADLKAIIVAEASKLGFSDPMDAFTIVDKSKVEYGEDGLPKNAAELVKAISQAKPYLVKSHIPMVNPANPSTSTATIQRTDQDRRKEYFSGGGGEFWKGGGVIGA